MRSVLAYLARCSTGQLGALIATQIVTVDHARTFPHFCNPTCWRRAEQRVKCWHKRKALLRNVVDNANDSETSAADQYVRGTVEGPALDAILCNRHRFLCAQSPLANTSRVHCQTLLFIKPSGALVLRRALVRQQRSQTATAEPEALSFPVLVSVCLCQCVWSPGRMR